MSLEVFGDEGDIGPEGYVTEERAEEMVKEALAAEAWKIPDDWYVCWLGTDIRGEICCQMSLHKRAEVFEESRTTFISRTGATHLKALLECINYINKENEKNGRK